MEDEVELAAICLALARGTEWKSPERSVPPEGIVDAEGVLVLVVVCVAGEACVVNQRVLQVTGPRRAIDEGQRETRVGHIVVRPPVRPTRGWRRPLTVAVEGVRDVDFKVERIHAGR